MATKRKVDDELLRPGVFVGRNPDTGVLTRLTILVNGQVIIDRKPYVSANTDRWTKTYETLTDDASKHLFLIHKIKSHPTEWSE